MSSCPERRASSSCFAESSVELVSARRGSWCRYHLSGHRRTKKRNQDELWFTAEVRTKQRLTSIEAVDVVSAPLGGTGRFFIDAHDDGTRSVFWRVRLIDFDMTKGVVASQVDKLRFRLVTR